MITLFFQSDCSALTSTEHRTMNSQMNREVVTTRTTASNGNMQGYRGGERKMKRGGALGNRKEDIKKKTAKEVKNWYHLRT